MLQILDSLVELLLNFLALFVLVLGAFQDLGLVLEELLISLGGLELLLDGLPGLLKFFKLRLSLLQLALELALV